MSLLTPLRLVERRPDVLLALVLGAVVSMLIVPFPPFVLDGLITVNIALSLVVLLVALFAVSVLEVSSFPTILLICTLFRLGLNVSTARGILARGDAGELVDAFGAFVVQGDIIVGLVSFAVVTLVQFMVIAKGSERVAEVAARFTLDAMPGKQMSIDAALRNGAITDAEAETKRQELGRTCQMFGNMDGAMKFVKGDAIAGLIITVINLVGGLSIGVLRNGLTAAEAMDVYSTLTIGDALVAQVSALLVTLAAGVLVTRVDGKSKNLGFSIKDELFGHTRALNVGAALMGLLAFVPGFPALPFLICAALTATWSFGRGFVPALLSEESETFEDELERSLQAVQQQQAAAERLTPSVVPITLDLSEDLSESLGFGDGADDATELVSLHIPQLRDALYLETGVRFPGIRVRPSAPGLEAGMFRLRVNDVPVLEEHLPADRWLATAPPSELERLAVDSQPIEHPVSKVVMSLVTPKDRAVIEASGITVWDTSGIIALYTASALRARATAFVGLQEVGELVERLEGAYPLLVREVVPKVATLRQLVDVLRRLVEEHISIRDMKTIVEAIGEHGERGLEPVWLTERVRGALGAQLAHSFAGLDKRISVVLLEPAIEDTVEAAIHSTRDGLMLSMDHDVCREVLFSIAEALEPAVASGQRPVVLTHSRIRRFVRRILETELPHVAVLSFDELPGDLAVQPLGRAALAA